MTENDGADPRQRLRPNRNDRHHDQLLLREVSTINDQTTRALGPLPPGGRPVIPKRKPQWPRPAVPPMAQVPPPSEEDTTMQWKSMAAVAVLATGGALTACGADGTAARIDPPAVAVPDAPAPVQLPTVDAVLPAAQATVAEPVKPADSKASEPVRGPAIPVAQLRRQILALLGSFERSEDWERTNVERVLGIHMSKTPNTGEDFYQYVADTTEGWAYWVDISRLYGKDEPTTTVIHLDDGAESKADQPTHCTLEFEPLAKELMGMGYERAEKLARFKGKEWWNFHKKFHHSEETVYLMIYLYRRHDYKSGPYCIESFEVSGE